MDWRSSSARVFTDYYCPIEAGYKDRSGVLPYDRAASRALTVSYHPPKDVKGSEERTIFVGRLPHEVEVEDIEKVFRRFGGIQETRLVRDIVTGAPRGYAFVVFERRRDAATAHSACQRLCIGGADVVVEAEFSRSLRGWRPRRLGGGLGGKKESGQLRFGGVARPFVKSFASAPGAGRGEAVSGQVRRSAPLGEAQPACRDAEESGGRRGRTDGGGRRASPGAEASGRRWQDERRRRRDGEEAGRRPGNRTDPPDLERPGSGAAEEWRESRRGVSEERQQSRRGVSEERQQSRRGVSEERRQSRRGVSEERRQSRRGVSEERRESRRGAPEERREGRHGVSEERQQSRRGTSEERHRKHKRRSSDKGSEKERRRSRKHKSRHEDKDEDRRRHHKHRRDR